MSWRAIIAWTLVAAASLWTAYAIFPSLFPIAPSEWRTTRAEAIEIAEDAFTKLGGEPVERPFRVVELYGSQLGEKIIEASTDQPHEAAASPFLSRNGIGGWRVTDYAPGARPYRWTYQALVMPSGELAGLLYQLNADDERPTIDDAEARQRADAFLTKIGIDLGLFGEPTLRRRDQQNRTDLELRYPAHEPLLGEEVEYGIQVTFLGDVLGGFQRWIEHPEEEALRTELQPAILVQNLWIMIPFLMMPFVGYYFLRHYHAGEVGVRRGVQVFGLVFVLGAITLIVNARGFSEGNNWGVLSREQTMIASVAQLTLFWYSTVAAVSALAWTVGEVRCRERWANKLAAFDAIFRRQFQNATVSAAALRGWATGLAIGSTVMIAAVVLRQVGSMPFYSAVFEPWWQHISWSGLTHITWNLSTGLFVDLFFLLFLLPPAVKRFGGVWGATMAVVVATFLSWPPLSIEPLVWGLPLSFLFNALLAAVFLRYDLVTALLASIVSSVLPSAIAFLHADDPFLQAQGVLPLALAALPLILSIRGLRSGEEFQYRWEDIPAHVRRIADRERQRVELETARRIQSSILPELPPQLNGIDLAHVYLPASEVGGDFYDVLALDDGRLAVAVGDVAGHGVSSGLIMSMAKSTLALQVTVDPRVEQVIETLNRTVHQSARLRLLTTLCYLVVDAERHEVTYASAGHLAPYRVTVDGELEMLAAGSYPLGVRDHVSIDLHTANLTPGDLLFLMSDGIVEARAEDSDEMFGFDRVEASLRRHAGGSPEEVRDAIMSEVEAFTRGAPREDDQTILVLRIP
ncbi:MAG: PP2C family protein-serine/threonine phosphatase [Acidobacteriota bacterium]